MTATPAALVSIVLSYNYQDYIRTTLTSILHQTMQDFEIVVIDDASTDASVEVIRSYNDPRIRLFVNDHNVGGASSYNRAVEEARGEWLVNLDADDWIAPEKSERQLAFAAADPGLDIIGTYLTLVDAEGNRHPEADVRSRNCSINRMRSSVLTSGFATIRWHASSTMVRRAAHTRIGLDDPAMVRAPDFDLWTRFLRQGCRIGMLPERLTFLRNQSRGVTRGDPLGTMLELTYARLRNLVPLLEERAQHPSLRGDAATDGLITDLCSSASARCCCRARARARALLAACLRCPRPPSAVLAGRPAGRGARARARSARAPHYRHKGLSVGSA